MTDSEMIQDCDRHVKGYKSNEIHRHVGCCRNRGATVEKNCGDVVMLWRRFGLFQKVTWREGYRLMKYPGKEKGKNPSGGGEVDRSKRPLMP